jgi:spore maturation protein CgeB
MRALLVSSFHISSTRDVWLKLVKGLTLNGVEVVPFDMSGRFALFNFLEDKMKRSKRPMPRDWSPVTLSYEVLLGAAVYHQCDWVIITSPQYMPAEIPGLMRRVGIKTAAVLTECPYEDTIHTPLTASACDAVFVSDKNSVGLFASFCPYVEYVPHCYDPDIHYPPEDESTRDENILFVGTGYQSRVKFLEKVEWPAPLDLYGWWPSGWLRSKSPLKPSVRKSKTPWVPTSKNGMIGLPVPQKDGVLTGTISSVTAPEETADLYRSASASFSIHRAMRYVGTDEEIADGEAYSLGPRNWELAGCRTFQISDFRQELVDVFGDTVPLYETPQEMSSLLKRAFTDPEWRKDLAYQQWEKAQPYTAQNVTRTVAQVLAAA